MSLNLFLDPITRDKILKILKTDNSDALYTFIYEAIHEKLNQGTRGNSNQGETALEGDLGYLHHSELIGLTAPEGISVKPLSDKSLKTLESLMPELSNSEKTVFSQDEIYGPGAAGLIWIFHNKFFPIKVVLNIIAQLMVRENKTWLNLDEYREEIIDGLEKFVFEIYRNIPLAFNIHLGYPVPEGVLFQRYEKMLKEKQKKFKANVRSFRGSTEEKIKQLVTSRLSSSRLRFFSQFIGKSLAKKYCLVYSGACFEMGFLIARGERKDLEVALSKSALDFIRLENPVISFLKNGEGHDRRTFSNEERDFILDIVKSRFELEARIIDIVLREITSEGPEAKNVGSFVREIFAGEKRRFLKEQYSDIMSLKDRFPISDDDVIKWIEEKETRRKPTAAALKKYKGYVVTKEEMLDYLVDKHLKFQIVGSISRINELFGYRF